MGIESVNGAGATNPLGGTLADGSAKAPEKPALDKEAFLKLLVAQLKHQDPMKPMEGTEYVAQLSQFAMVEQSLAQTQKLDLMSAQMRGISNNEATSLVGKSVTMRGSTVAYDGLLATGASVTLGDAAKKVTVAIKDESGRVVRTLELGAKAAGAMPITWDGKDDSGQPVAAGKYSLDVKAGTDAGAVSVTHEVTATVPKVTSDKGYPELAPETGSTAPSSDLGSVGRATKPEEAQ